MSLFNKAIVATLPLVPKPLVRHFAGRYIAGDKLEDAVRVTGALNKRGIRATIDVLGEEVDSREEALAAVQDYKNVLAAIDAEKLDANVSLKPTMFGLKIDKGFCQQNIAAVCDEAERYGNFVRIDMEDSTCTQDTLDIYYALREKYDEVGTVIQSYLRRSLADCAGLAAAKANLRLCKGIYNEPREPAYKDKAVVNANYGLLLDVLLGGGCYVGIATHDEKMVWEGLRAVHEFGLKRDQYEFQMLLGVDAKLRDIIVAAGHKLRIYVPFGTAWYPYSTRRLKENPRLAGQIFRNIFVKYEFD
ncbi:MAG TPA: proline dehydrogenase family protein [bacterium]|nr:proline dehydrogenase family protein [bacterium]